MIQKLFRKNKKKYLEYNNLRRRIFQESFADGAFAILYQIPWLISINRPECPGFVKKFNGNFRIFDCGYEKNIKKVEDDLKKDFNIKEPGTLLTLSQKIIPIEGLYTIGSVGTISQTPDSDCDIWICYDKKYVTDKRLQILKFKTDEIAAWISTKIKIPVYFFLMEKNDIKKCRFGGVGGESSGTAQANVLKEEFYRTMILISGKIPFWWVCYEKKQTLDYEQAVQSLDDPRYWNEEYIDLGNLEKVDPGESFGAALWQLNKSLEKPLKSIFKMLLLKMQLEALDDELVCHKFRQHITIKSLDKMLPDPVVFSMFFLMNYYQQQSDAATVNFVNECFFLRCQIKGAVKPDTIKRKMTDVYFQQFNIDRTTRLRLEKFDTWGLLKQISFGWRIFNFLLQTYRDISKQYAGINSRVDKIDLTILGRKIQACYEQKTDKVTYLPKPTGKFEFTWLSLMYKANRWVLFCENDKTKVVYSADNAVHMVFFMVYNGLFDPARLRMIPNPSGVTLQEIFNLGNWILSDIMQAAMEKMDERDFLKPAYIKDLIIIINFDLEVCANKISDIGVAVLTSWGEIYVKKFDFFSQFRGSLQACGGVHKQTRYHYYIRKKHKHYADHIAIAKRELGLLLKML